MGWCYVAIFIIHPPAPAGALPNGQNIQECWPRSRLGGREPVQSGGAAADLVPTLQRKLEYPSFLAGAAQKRPQTCAGGAPRLVICCHQNSSSSPGWFEPRKTPRPQRPSVVDVKVIDHARGVKISLPMQGNLRFRCGAAPSITALPAPAPRPRPLSHARYLAKCAEVRSCASLAEVASYDPRASQLKPWSAS